MDKPVIIPDGMSAAFFEWSTTKKSKNLALSDENLKVRVTEGSGFKTVLGNMAFKPGGKYYFEVFIIKGNLIKIGVSRDSINFEEAFSDSLNGWAIYNGELRHNSNSKGQKYGSGISQGNTVGVALDMTEGTLSYFYNGVPWGVAYKDDKLKEGDLYAACAPIYVSDSFILKMMIPED